MFCYLICPHPCTEHKLTVGEPPDGKIDTLPAAHHPHPSSSPATDSAHSAHRRPLEISFNSRTVPLSAHPLLLLFSISVTFFLKYSSVHVACLLTPFSGVLLPTPCFQDRDVFLSHLPVVSFTPSSSLDLIFRNFYLYRNNTSTYFDKSESFRKTRRSRASPRPTSKSYPAEAVHLIPWAYKTVSALQ